MPSTPPDMVLTARTWPALASPAVRLRGVREKRGLISGSVDVPIAQARPTDGGGVRPAPGLGRHRLPSLRRVVLRRVQREYVDLSLSIRPRYREKAGYRAEAAVRAVVRSAPWSSRAITGTVRCRYLTDPAGRAMRLRTQSGVRAVPKLVPRTTNCWPITTGTRRTSRGRLVLAPIVVSITTGRPASAPVALDCRPVRASTTASTRRSVRERTHEAGRVEARDCTIRERRPSIG